MISELTFVSLTQGTQLFPPTPRARGQGSKPFPISLSSLGLRTTLANAHKESSEKPAREEEKVQTITDGRLAHLI